MSDLTPAKTRAAPAGATAVSPAVGIRRVALVMGLWLAVAVIYWPSSLALARLWTNVAEETYTHGFLILAISLWLVVRARHKLSAAPVRPALPALIPLLLLSALWVWAWRAAIQELHMMLVPVILFTAIVAALGWRVARILIFPVGYLYFALPFWSNGVFLLQDLSAKMVGVLVWLTGVPAFVQGNVIELPSGAIRIAG
ncbi:exosortase 1, partial [mine drainage metagenome]